MRWRSCSSAGAAEARRGYRRVVASPRPVRIVESAQIRSLVDAGFVVIAVGGGGIPVVEPTPGTYRGVEAVIDKDRASALLAASLEVPLLVLSTGVERVAVHFRQPNQRFLDRISATEASGYLADGEFPKGSMGPKIEAAIAFHVLINLVGLLGEILLGDVGALLMIDELPWSAVPVTLARTGLYLGLSLLVARRLNLQTRTRPSGA